MKDFRRLTPLNYGWCAYYTGGWILELEYFQTNDWKNACVMMLGSLIALKNVSRLDDTAKLEYCTFYQARRDFRTSPHSFACLLIWIFACLRTALIVQWLGFLFKEKLIT